MNELSRKFSRALFLSSALQRHGGRRRVSASSLLLLLAFVCALPATALAGDETPWGSNMGVPTSTNIGWNYAMGYHFTPQVDGVVTQLGGYFNGTKTVKLWDKVSGTELAQAQVTSANSWSYTSITPVPVQAGVTYTVAAYMAGSGASYKSGGATGSPTFGNIKIESGAYASTSSNPNAIPTNNPTSIYGQADICFSVGGGEEFVFNFDDAQPTQQGEAIDFENDSSPRDLDTYQVLDTGIPAGTTDGSALKITSEADPTNDDPTLDDTLIHYLPDPGDINGDPNPVGTAAPAPSLVFDRDHLVDFEKNEFNRVKARSFENFKLGEYRWRVQLPDLEAGANNAVAAWVFSDSSGANDTAAREVDFEIGYGTDQDRVRYGLDDAAAPANALKVLMTIQTDTSTGTVLDSFAFDPIDRSKHVHAGAWYTFSIVLSKNFEGAYIVTWFILDEASGEKMLGRSEAITHYTLVETEFDVLASSESFSAFFMGKSKPQTDRIGYIDFIDHTRAITPLISDMGDTVGDPAVASDTALETGATSIVDREWFNETRNIAGNPAFVSLEIGEPQFPLGPQSITTIDGDFVEWGLCPNTEEATLLDVNCDPILDANGNPQPNPAWDPIIHGGFPDIDDPDTTGSGQVGNEDNEWTRFGGAFAALFVEDRDTSLNPVLTFRARFAGTGAAPAIEVLLQDSDGDVWGVDVVKHPELLFTATSSFSDYSVVLKRDNFILVDVAGGLPGGVGSAPRTFDLDDIKLIGFRFGEKGQAVTSPNLQIARVEFTKVGDTTPTLITDVEGDTAGSGAGAGNVFPPLFGTAATDKKWYREGTAATDNNLDLKIFNVGAPENNVVRGHVANFSSPQGTDDNYTFYYSPVGANFNFLQGSVLNKTLHVLGDWGALSAPGQPVEWSPAIFGGRPWFGVRYFVPTSPTPGTLDISGGPSISLKAKYGGDGLSAAPEFQLTLQDTDGEIWASRKFHKLTTDYQTYVFKVSPGDFSRVDFAPGTGDATNPAHDNKLNGDGIEAIGLSFISSNVDGMIQTAGRPEFWVDDIEWSVPLPVENQQVVTIGDWTTGQTAYDINYNIEGGPIDLTNKSLVTYQMKYDYLNDINPVTGDPRICLTFEEADGDRWVTLNEHTITTEYKGYAYDLANEPFVLLGGTGNGVRDVTQVTRIGFRFLRWTGPTNGNPQFLIDEIYHSQTRPPAVAVHPASFPVVSGVEEPDVFQVFENARDGSRFSGFPLSAAEATFPAWPAPANANEADFGGILQQKGAWSRFGFPLEQVHINSVPAMGSAANLAEIQDVSVSEGVRSIQIRCIWDWEYPRNAMLPKANPSDPDKFLWPRSAEREGTLGTRCGIRYMLNDGAAATVSNGVDLGTKTFVSYDIRSPFVDAKHSTSEHRLILMDRDGDTLVGPSNVSTTTGWQTFSVDVAPLAAAANVDLTRIVYIGLDLENLDVTAPYQDFNIDNFTAASPPLTVPFSENFTGGLPVNGWEYASSNASLGRIEVLNGRLEMDVTVNNNINLNEATVHLNLNGATNVVLTADLFDFADEETAMPVSFSGSSNSDGIAVSDDGVNWYRVVSLPNGNLVGQVYNLDTVVNANAGLDYSSDFRIKFQQYDNYAKTTDGRGFDNLTVTANIAPPAAPSSLAASAVGETQIDMTWSDNSSTETGFEIDRKVGTGAWVTNFATAGVNATSFSDTGLTASTLYTYRVRSTNGGGDSANSNESSDTTQGPPPPPTLPSLTSFGIGSGVQGTITNMPQPSTAWHVRTWIKTDLYYAQGVDATVTSGGTFSAHPGLFGTTSVLWVTLHPASTDPWGTGTTTAALSSLSQGNLGAGAIVFGPF